MVVNGPGGVVLVENKGKLAMAEMTLSWLVSFITGPETDLLTLPWLFSDLKDIGGIEGSWMGLQEILG